MGTRLKRLRKAAHLSQEELAERAGVPVGSLRNYEQDRRALTLAAAAKLARALDVTIDVLAQSDTSNEGTSQ